MDMNISISCTASVQRSSKGHLPKAGGFLPFPAPDEEPDSESSALISESSALITVRLQLLLVQVVINGVQLTPVHEQLPEVILRQLQLSVQFASL